MSTTIQGGYLRAEIARQSKDRMPSLTLLSYGAGTNSTAILVGLHERGEMVDGIIFADTGGEKPATYEHLHVVNAWGVAHGFPPITTVRGSQPAQVRRGSLEAECLELGTMPSKVFGYGNCSQKWKIDPQNKHGAAFAESRGLARSDIIRLLGFDADEPERMERAIRHAEKQQEKQRFPLIEWGWGREECVAAIKRAGLPQPGKSACWFCPSSKKHEVLWLRDNHPDLFARAVAMEQRALRGEGQAPTPTTVKGLGRHWSWKELAEASDKSKFSDAGLPDTDCGCYDGMSGEDMA